MSGRLGVVCVCAFFARPLLASACGGSWRLTPQQAPSAGSQSQSSAATPSAGDPSPPPTKKPKRVWTNEDLGESSATAPQPSEEKNSSKAKGTPKKSTDPYVVSVRQQLQRLQAQLADIDKQITDLTTFSKGETSGNASLQLHRRYSSEPIDAQIGRLQEKKKQLEAKQEALLDDARKKGVDPGQLR